MKLPRTYDIRVKPTIKHEWRGLHPWRPQAFWWRLAYVIRINRIRHKNTMKIKEVCEALDLAFPHYTIERKPRVKHHRIRTLPSY